MLVCDFNHAHVRVTCKNVKNIVCDCRAFLTSSTVIFHSLSQPLGSRGCPNVAQLLDVVREPDQSQVCLVFEYFRHKPFKVLRVVPPSLGLYVVFIVSGVVVPPHERMACHAWYFVSLDVVRTSVVGSSTLPPHESDSSFGCLLACRSTCNGLPLPTFECTCESCCVLWSACTSDPLCIATSRYVAGVMQCVFRGEHGHRYLELNCCF